MINYQSGYLSVAKGEPFMVERTRLWRLLICTAVILAGFCFVCHAQEMTKQQRLENTLYVQSMNYSAAKDGVLTVVDSDDKSVTPIVADGVFYVPARFVFESFGLKVSWNDAEKRVIVSGGGKHVFLSVNDDTVSLETLSEKLSYDCYIDNSRTYIALEDVSKIMKCHTYYYQANKAAVIAVGEEWDSERDAEKQAHSAMEFAVSPFFKMFT